jgi:hypothetical protein
MEAFPLEMPKVSARLNRVSHSSFLQIERCPETMATNEFKI